MTGPLTNKLFRAALAAGKRVRTETAVQAGHASVASVAVDLAQTTLGDLQDRHVLIIGAGETAELMARALHARGVRTVFVANRRRERALALAAQFGGGTAGLDALPAELGRADIVLASTSSPHPIVGEEELATVMDERHGRPLLIIDLAVPRDVEHACGTLPGVTLYDVDGLQAEVDRHRLVRRAEARRAEGLVEEEIQAFAGWLGSLEVLPTIAALRARGDAIVDQVLADNAGRWEGASPRDLERVEALARAVANRLLHEPTVRAKALDGEHRHARLHVLRELFGLEDDAPAAADAPPAEVRTLRRR
jgi:glutamyl-tRNA reductase